jgi:drug/metabolite transporter (DMT)-like permease
VPTGFDGEEDDHDGSVGFRPARAGAAPVNRPTFALLLVSLLWGTTFVAVKAGLDDASPILFVGIRFGIAALLSLALVRDPRVIRQSLAVGVPLGAMMAFGYASQSIGLTMTTPSRSAFVTGLNVALVPLWAACFFGRRPPALSVLGLVVTIPGLWLLTGPTGGGWNAGDSWTLVCAVFFALHLVALSRFAPRADPGGLLVTQLAATSGLCFLASPLLETPRVVVTSELALALLVTAVFAGVFVSWLQIRYQPRVDPTRAAVVYVTEPVFAAFFSWWITGEVFAPIGWIGAALILSGMLLSELGGARRARGAAAVVTSPHP